MIYFQLKPYDDFNVKVQKQDLRTNITSLVLNALRWLFFNSSPNRCNRAATYVYNPSSSYGAPSGYRTDDVTGRRHNKITHTAQRHARNPLVPIGFFGLLYRSIVLRFWKQFPVHRVSGAGLFYRPVSRYVCPRECLHTNTHTYTHRETLHTVCFSPLPEMVSFGMPELTLHFQQHATWTNLYRGNRFFVVVSL